jgi:hypothetical protein
MFRLEMQMLAECLAVMDGLGLSLSTCREYPYGSGLHNACQTGYPNLSCRDLRVQGEGERCPRSILIYTADGEKAKSLIYMVLLPGKGKN